MSIRLPSTEVNDVSQVGTLVALDCRASKARHLQGLDEPGAVVLAKSVELTHYIVFRNCLS